MEEDFIDPFATMIIKDLHPFFYLALSIAYNLARIILVISIIYYLCKYMLFY